MDTPISGSRLNEEKAFSSRFTAGLESHPVNYPVDFVTPLEDRPRKVQVLNVPVREPPAADASDEAGISQGSVSITIKSLKPSLTIPLTAHVSDPISSLKTLISEASSTPVPIQPEFQRLLLKGKALTDSKLLKEYGIEDGAVIHLMLKSGWDASPTMKSHVPPAETSTSNQVPKLILTTEDLPSGVEAKPQDIPPQSSESQAHVTSSSFHKVISDPSFWAEVLDLCKSKFLYEADAANAFEEFLRAHKASLSASEIAKIRDTLGVEGMGGV